MQEILKILEKRKYICCQLGLVGMLISTLVRTLEVVLKIFFHDLDLFLYFLLRLIFWQKQVLTARFRVARDVFEHFSICALVDVHVFFHRLGASGFCVSVVADAGSNSSSQSRFFPTLG